MKLRRHQREIIEQYKGGLMGIAAVPGSGKTTVLSELAVAIILEKSLKDDEEILIVTYANSSVKTFTERIAARLAERNRIHFLGYRVRTLHGLANDIVREYPSKVGLPDDYSVIDDHDADRILEQCAKSWLQAHPYGLDEYLDPDLSAEKVNSLRPETLPRRVTEIAKTFISYIKNCGLSPDEAERVIKNIPAPLPLAQMGVAVYQDYQRSLSYRGAVDYADLIRLAHLALRTNPGLVSLLQRRWPFILEDECQDSSGQQEEILKLLVGDGGNWVRVGDPNQAVYQTFTNANPRYLREFLKRPDVDRRNLPVSSRSVQVVIDLANRLIDWTSQEHPVEPVRDALSLPKILPADKNDPKPNPVGGRIYVDHHAYSEAEEVQAVVKSLQTWLPANSNMTVAVLVPSNRLGKAVVSELENKNVPYIDGLLNTTASTRTSADALNHVLQYLDNPRNASELAKAWQALQTYGKPDEMTKNRAEVGATLIRSFSKVEDFIHPLPDEDILEKSGVIDRDETLYRKLVAFREMVRKWLRAALLPVDQLVITISEDMFKNPAQLAIAFRISSVLKYQAELNPDWRMQQFAQTVEEIATNQRKILGADPEDLGFDPDNYPGQVAVCTIHKAKGAEWDRVYLLGLNDDDFPSGRAEVTRDPFNWFVRNQMNLDKEALAQLDAALSTDEYDWYDPGKSTQIARYDQARERIRLAYVGITRARRELYIAWDKGKKGKNGPSEIFQVVQQFYEGMKSE